MGQNRNIKLRNSGQKKIKNNSLKLRLRCKINKIRLSNFIDMFFQERPIVNGRAEARCNISLLWYLQLPEQTIQLHSILSVLKHPYSISGYDSKFCNL